MAKVGRARQILDSRGAPAVEVGLHTNKAVHRASTSETIADAVNATRDAQKRRLLAKAVADAVRLINVNVSEALMGMDPSAGAYRPGHHFFDMAHHKAHRPNPDSFLFSTSVVNRLLHCKALCGNNLSSRYHVS
ncbi:hypothetical protein ACQ4PT_017442 [Festuca glaucescens]